MADLSWSWGSITSLTPEETRAHVHAGPSWYVCEEMDRQPDIHAVWHRDCHVCRHRLVGLLRDLPGDVAPRGARWVAERMA